MAKPREERIWDPALRIFHWVLAAAVLTSWGLGEYGPNIMTLHFWCGYLIIALLVFRLVWGVVGPRPARFASFVAGPVTTIRYLGHFLSAKPSHWPGHSPMGGWAVVAILCLLAAQVTTGLLADPEDFVNVGPLAHLVDAAGNRQASAWHEIGASLILGFVVVHLAVMAWYRLRKGEDLIKPMLTGRKLVDRDQD